VPSINKFLPLIQSLAEEEIISTLNFFFFIIPSRCFLNDAFALPVVLPIDFSTLLPCSLALNILSNRPAGSAVPVDQAFRLGAKALAVVKIEQIKVSPGSTLMVYFSALCSFACQ